MLLMLEGAAAVCALQFILQSRQNALHGLPSYSLYIYICIYSTYTHHLTQDRVPHWFGLPCVWLAWTTDGPGLPGFFIYQGHLFPGKKDTYERAPNTRNARTSPPSAGVGSCRRRGSQWSDGRSPPWPLRPTNPRTMGVGSNSGAVLETEDL